MNRLEYFKARLEANISPMEYVRAAKENPKKYLLIDVRVGPLNIKKEKIQNSIEVPVNEFKERLSELPKDKEIIVCWDVWCTLASKAAVLLLENGYDAKELYGGLEAWKTLNLPITQLGEVSEKQSIPITNENNDFSCEC
jgi:rhodanese-related sulfurtransferase